MRVDEIELLDDDEDEWIETTPKDTTFHVEHPSVQPAVTFENNEAIAKDETGIHALPLGVDEEFKVEGLNTLIHKVARQETSLARDVAYFGKVDLQYILEGYDLTMDELKAKLEEPRFANLVAKYSADIGDDYEGLMRVRAKAYLESVGLTRLQQLISDPRTKDETVIKAIMLMGQMGGAMPKNGSGDGSGGTSIVFNFGDKNPFVKRQVTVEHE